LNAIESADAPFRAWFEALQACVRRVDYDAARELFADDAIGFGTRASFVVGLDSLMASQWQGIWPNIRDFAFDLDTMHSGADGAGAWAIATWTSTGFDPATGAAFDRPGRATVIFTRVADRWRARHTHFSLFPGTPQTTRRPT
jgi:ketosteroid isomerase-like protein